MKKIICLFCLFFMCSCAGWLGTVKEGVTTIREGYQTACELVELYKVMRVGYAKSHKRICLLIDDKIKRDKCLNLLNDGLNASEMIDELFRGCPIDKKPVSLKESDFYHPPPAETKISQAS